MTIFKKFLFLFTALAINSWKGYAEKTTCKDALAYRLPAALTPESSNMVAFINAFCFIEFSLNGFLSSNPTLSKEGNDKIQEYLKVVQSLIPLFLMSFDEANKHAHALNHSLKSMDQEQSGLTEGVFFAEMATQDSEEKASKVKTDTRKKSQCMDILTNTLATTQTPLGSMMYLAMSGFCTMEWVSQKVLNTPSTPSVSEDYEIFQSSLPWIQDHAAMFLALFDQSNKTPNIYMKALNDRSKRFGEKSQDQKSS